jgi:lipid A disaccharide synthetase
MILIKKFSSICIVAGSPSNDLRASKIMRALKRKNPDIKFFGLGG